PPTAHPKWRRGLVVEGGGSVGREPQSALHQVHDAGDVVQQVRARDRRVETQRGRGRKSGGRIAKLFAVADRLLEVIADESIELDQLAGRIVEPAGELFMEGRPQRLRQSVVGRIAD